MAKWIKVSIFLISFFSMNVEGSKFLTSPAICTEYWLASNLVMGPITDWPLHSLSHVLDTPISNGVTNPNPVTTTRRGVHSVIEELRTHHGWKTRIPVSY